MITFVLPGFERFSPRRPAPFEIVRFSNGQEQAVLGRAVRGEDCQVVGSLMSSEDIVRCTLLADALKRAGAKTVTLFAPYLAYSRQDEPEAGRSLGVAWLGGLLKASGIQAITTIDLHSRAAARACPLPLRSLSPAPVFSGALGPLDEDTLVVAPDDGARERARLFARAAGLGPPLVLTKRRTSLGVRLKPVIPARLPDHAVVVDDILDTGATMVAACRLLNERGVKHIQVVVTHPLFSGRRWRELRDLHVEQLYVGDTLPLPSALTAWRGCHVCPMEQLLTAS